MKRVLFIMFLGFMYFQTFAQDQHQISLVFENESIIDVLGKIENKTDFNFFYIESWFSESTKISGKFDNVGLEEILSRIFENTKFNFFVTEQRIILTKNEAIYDYLPEQFFGLQRDTVVEVIRKRKIKKEVPILTNKENKRNNEALKTIRIGKRILANDISEHVISGVFTNAITGTAVEDALIIINGQHTGIRTDKNGRYELSLASGIYNFEVNALGMESFRAKVELFGDGVLDLQFNEKIEQLDAVILEKKEENVVEEVITKTKINIKEAKNIPLALGERDALRVATTLPGISTTGESGVGYNVRGGKADQNLILLDKAVVYNPQHFFGIFSALNPFVLDEANIFKNNIPAQYGGRLSSVFDLTTKDASTSKIKGEASIGPVTGNILLETPVVKDKSGFLIGGRGAYANYILRELNEESLQNSEASFYDIIAKYHHKINKKSNVRLTGYGSQDNFSITSDSLFTYKNKAFSLQWDYRFNQKNKGELTVANSEYNFEIEYDGQSNNDFELSYDINELHAKLNFDHYYNEKIKLNYGLSNKLYRINPGTIQPLNNESSIIGLEIESEKALESAAYLGGLVDINDKLKLDLGLRYSVYNALGPGSQNVYASGLPRTDETLVETLSLGTNEVYKTYGGLEQRLSGRYLLGPELSMKMSYNKSFQFIHTLSNNITVSPIDTWKLSDLNIKPQSSHQFSLGFYKNLNDQMYEISLEGFYKRMNNIVDFKTGAEILLNENIETEVLQGEGKAYGVELLIKKQKGKLYGWLGYTYARSFNRFDGTFAEERINNGDFFPSNFDKPHDLSVVMNYKFTKRYSISTNFVYQTGRPITYPVGRFTFNNADYTVFSDRNSFRIPDFYRLDLGVNIEGNHKKKKLAHSFWTISVYNVLGRNNPYSVFFITEEGKVKGLQTSIFTIPVPSVTYNLKF